MDSISPDSESKASSRLGRFGSQIFQRTVGWVSRSRSECQVHFLMPHNFVRAGLVDLFKPHLTFSIVNEGKIG